MNCKLLAYQSISKEIFKYRNQNWYEDSYIYFNIFCIKLSVLSELKSYKFIKIIKIDIIKILLKYLFKKNQLIIK